MKLWGLALGIFLFLIFSIQNVVNSETTQHTVIINDADECAKSTITGTNYGVYSSDTRTCTLTSDLTEGTEIGVDDITLDCDGHVVTGDGSSNGILVQNKENITVKNCVVHNFYNGIQFSSTTQSSLINNTVKNNFNDGFHLENSNYNTLEFNIAENNQRFCTCFII